MTVRIVAVHQHPRYCEVCEGTKRVTVRTVVPSGGGTCRNLWRWSPTRLALVIDCPQCTGAEELLAHLPRDPADLRVLLGGEQ